MRLNDYVGMAAHQLGKNRMRTVLTIIGIMIGVASMITVISVSDGGQSMINDELLKFGINRVWFFPSNLQGPNNMLDLADVNMLKSINGIEAVAPSAYEKAYLSYQNKKIVSDVVGTNESLFDMEQMAYLEGRGLTENDIEYARRVVILSEEAKNKLFGDGEAEGKKIVGADLCVCYIQGGAGLNKRKVIFVTDGDRAAQKAVETAAANVGGRCISASGGNPTVLSGQEIVELIKQAKNEPIVVMVDDRGKDGEGKGEKAMREIIGDGSIDVLGVVAVSSNGKDCNGLNVSCSITKEGNVIEEGVDKYGNRLQDNFICGDTLSILKEMNDLVIVGIGDPGKMDFNDEVEKGAPITTKALQEVLNRSGR
jgi:stage V sporulation protein AE